MLPNSKKKTPLIFLIRYENYYFLPPKNRKKQILQATTDRTDKVVEFL